MDIFAKNQEDKDIFFKNGEKLRDWDPPIAAPGYQNNAYCFFLALMLYNRVLINNFLGVLKIYSITENYKPIFYILEELGKKKIL